MNESRVQFLESSLSMLGYDKALEAMDWMISEMCVERGFARHNGSHYYYHLIDATQDLLNHGVKDEDILTACLLHDALEDIEGITPKMIEDKFNGKVASLVFLVTKNKGIDYKQEENMIVYLRIISESIGASLIKTADRKHNFSTLQDASPEKKLRQALETEKLFIPFFKSCRKKYPRYSAYFYSAKTSIEPHLNEIKEHYEEVQELNRQIEMLKKEKYNG